MLRFQNSLPELGVGVVYSPGLDSLLQNSHGLVDVVEVEPQTTWIQNPETPGVTEARFDIEEHLASLPGRKLIHSIGTPVGGSVDALGRQLPLLRQTIQKLDAPFASEHLAFNLTPDFFTGFFLPPRQTKSGIEIYKQAITRLQDGLGVPLAIETGVNYLKPRAGEIPDGEFVSELVASSGCGILLDLHNVYCNQLNGRQPIRKFVSQIPLDRIWELHLAGGFELDGFWLDAHSGAIPAPLVEIARELIPEFPNLKAIVFEIFPSFLPAFGIEAVKRQLETLHELWNLRGKHDGRNTPVGPATALPDTGPTVREWEQSLGRMVLDRPVQSAFEESVAQDPGVALMRQLIQEFRASMVVSVYRLTSRLLMLTLTPEVFRGLMEDYWRRFNPQQYSAPEADGFFQFLISKNVRVPWFREVFEFERAAMLTILDSRTRILRFSADPLPVLRALAEARMPDLAPRPGDFEIELKPEGPISISGIELDAVAQTFPFH